jgi:CHAT domain-containing protein/tetratricopeptide (TPR) repeat protein
MPRDLAFPQLDALLAPAPGGAPSVARDARRKLPALCLCLLLAVCWSLAAHSSAAAQGQKRPERPLTPEQAAQAAEASRLNEQALKLAGEGKHAEALPLAERVLVLRENALGHTHPDVAASLNNIASLFRALGDYARAETLFRSALALREANLSPEHPDVAQSLNNLGLLYIEKGDYARAEPLLERALALREKVFGLEHPEVANTVYNLASLCRVKGDDGRAELLYRRALAILEKAGPARPGVSYPLAGLATLYQEQGDYARATPLLERALAIREKALGPEHPQVVSALDQLAELCEAQGEMSRAVEIRSRGQETRERLLSRTLATGSERLKLRYLATLSGETAATVSLHVRSAPADPLALQLSLTTILRRKGRALDAMSDQVASLRHSPDPQDRALLDRLSEAQSQLAKLALNEPVKPSPAAPAPDGDTIRPADAPAGGRRPRRPEPPSAASRMQAGIERLQEAVSRRSAEISVQTPPITIEQARQAIPDGAALVEFFSYKPLDVKAKRRAERFGPARYVVYALRREGAPQWADLGEAAVVDAGIKRLLTAFKCPQTMREINQCPTIAEVKRLAREVDERVMRPVRRLTGNARHLFLSPDGALNLLPFAALVDEKNKYLVESYTLTYLTSGRDLLRLQQNAESRQPPLIVANPDFGANGPPAAAARATANETGTALARRSNDMAQAHFNPLAGTGEEAKALSAVMPGVRLLTQEQASEAALKHVSAPRVLHIATHGFFLPDQPVEATDGARGLVLADGEEPRALTRSENPLLRSGLALAGANSGQGGRGEDGILTALEASALDLWGTKLVVLSACETGVGEVRNGEGVYGLRRALVLAGSESQVMSLWQVSDEATRDLMISYYRRLMAGEGRTEALRQVQLEMLRGGKVEAGGRQRGIGVQGSGAEDRRHPYFWAAFIQSGDWRGMQAQPARAE